MLLYDPTIHAWGALADSKEGEGALWFQADELRTKPWGEPSVRLLIQWAPLAGLGVVLASGRIVVESDLARRGLALSAHEQASRLGVQLTLADLRALLDSFVADVMGDSVVRQVSPTTPSMTDEPDVMAREPW